MLQAPWWQIDLAFAPSIPAGLRAEVLEGTDQRARQALGTAYGVSAWFVTAFEDDQALMAALQQAGFADQYDVGEDAWSKVWMQRPVDLPVKAYRIPAGFTLRPLAGEAETDNYRDTARALYEHMGFETVREVHVWSKAYEQ